MINNKIKKIIIPVLVFLAILLFFIMVFKNEDNKKVFQETEKIEEKKEVDYIKEYAEKEGYTQYFSLEGQWYTSVDGSWIKAQNKEEAKVMNYASRNGYTQYFSFEGQWYTGVDGSWIKAQNKEEAINLYKRNKK